MSWSRVIRPVTCDASDRTSCLYSSISSVNVLVFQELVVLMLFRIPASRMKKVRIL